MTASQGSAQQDVYLTGSNFFLERYRVRRASRPSRRGSANDIHQHTLLRATIPANLLTAAGQDQISVVRQNGSPNVPGPLALTVNPTRPAIVASAPDSVSQNPLRA